MAIDREIITERITARAKSRLMAGYRRLSGYQGQQVEWADLDAGRAQTEAQRLYAEAGYSKDNPLKVEILYNTNENHKRLSVAIASMWKQTLGVETTLVNEEWKVFLETRRRKETTEVFRAGWIGDYNDAFTFSQLRYSKNEMNHSGYANPAYDALLERAAMESDPVERAKIMAGIGTHAPGRHAGNSYLLLRFQAFSQAVGRRASAEYHGSSSFERFLYFEALRTLCFVLRFGDFLVQFRRF